MQPLFKFDPCGFPMYWVAKVQAHIHWFPVTKLQFELFLASEANTTIDQDSYAEMLKGNPRVGSGDVGPDNYWKAFVSGVLPREANRYAKWCGNGYRIPTLQEWLDAFYELESSRKDIRVPEKEPLPERRLELIRALNALAPRPADESAPGAACSLADRTLMRGGLVEWVHDGNEATNWGGMGEAHSALSRSLTKIEQEDPIEPKDANNTRVPHFGFRLLFFEAQQARESS